MDTSHKKPLVSIVLPTYNGQKYLDEAIESCLNQTFKDFELIIVDDTSKDDSPNIIARWAAKDSRIKPIRNKENKKLPRSLNTGFEQAQGTYHTWTSDDNILEPNFLETLVNEIQKSGADLVYSDYVAIDDDGKKLEICYATKPEYFPMTGGIGASFLYKKEVYEALGGYNPDLFLLEDYDFWVRTYLHGFRFRHIGDIVYKYRRHGASLTESSKNSIMTKTANYRYDLRTKMKLDPRPYISFRWELLRNSWRVFSAQQIAVLCTEMVTHVPRLVVPVK